jgi:hypothetical protein
MKFAVPTTDGVPHLLVDKKTIDKISLLMVTLPDGRESYTGSEAAVVVVEALFDCLIRSRSLRIAAVTAVCGRNALTRA